MTGAEAGAQAVGQGEGDPGYGSTHRMVLEAALSLALEVPPGPARPAPLLVPSAKSVVALEQSALLSCTSE